MENIEKDVIEKFNFLLEKFSKRYDGLQISSVKDISKIPITKREDITDFDVKNCPVRPSIISNTSGTEGANSQIFYSRIESLEQIFNRLYSLFSAAGIDIDKDIILDITDIPLLPFINPKGKYFTVCNCGMYNKIKKEMVRSNLDKLKPSVLFAYPSLLSDFLDDISEEHISCIRNIILTGQPINEHMRKKIHDKIKDAEIHMLYASTEFAFIAVQEKESSSDFLLAEEGLFLEITNKEGSFREGKGELLVTDFNNLSMPVIRYRVGDVVEIISKNGKRYLRWLGRTGYYIKINGAVEPKQEIKDFTYSILNHENYVIEVYQDDNLKDYLIIKVKGDEKHFPKLRNAFKEIYGIDSEITIFDKQPVSHTGKKINIIDKRNLEDYDQSC